MRRAAAFRVVEQQCLREFEAAKQRWRRELQAWAARRLAVTATLMDIPVRSVTEADIWECGHVHGIDFGPRPLMRTDRRHGPRRRP